MTHTEQTEARIAEINITPPWHESAERLAALARELAAKLDAP